MCDMARLSGNRGGTAGMKGGLQACAAAANRRAYRCLDMYSW